MTYEHYQINSRLDAPSAEYFARFEKQGMGINLASYVGATQVRRMVLGDADQAAHGREQLEQHEGALVPRSHEATAPLAFPRALRIRARALRQNRRTDRARCREFGKFGGIYSTHMRNESDAIVLGYR
jgi:N-acyl-D-amino-acid deacylase